MVIQGKPRRFVLAILVSLLLALFVREAVAQHIPTPAICKTTTPADWEWWENWCWNYPAAVQPPFLVRVR